MLLLILEWEECLEEEKKEEEWEEYLEEEEIIDLNLHHHHHLNLVDMVIHLCKLLVIEVFMAIHKWVE